MSIRFLPNFPTILLTVGVAPSTVSFSIGAAAAININATFTIGDVVYLVLADGTREEVIKYTHNELINITSPVLPVTRGQLGTTAKTWGKSSCLKFSLTEGILNELICQKIRQGC
jgi:hypothetical protein